MNGDNNLEGILSDNEVNSFVESILLEDRKNKEQVSELALESEGDSIVDTFYNGSWKFMPYSMVRGTESCHIVNNGDEHYARVILQDPNSDYIGIALLKMDNIADEREFNLVFDSLVRELIKRYEAKGIDRDSLTYDLHVDYDRNCLFFHESPSPVLLAKGLTEEEIAKHNNGSIEYLGRVKSLNGLQERYKAA